GLGNGVLDHLLNLLGEVLRVLDARPRRGADVEDDLTSVRDREQLLAEQGIESEGRNQEQHCRDDHDPTSTHRPAKEKRVAAFEHVKAGIARAEKPETFLSGIVKLQEVRAKGWR